jgi:peroxiredoxin
VLKFFALPLALALLMPAAPAFAADPPAKAVVGQPAPDFTGTDSNGVKHTLSEHKGKTVVLEWTNPLCPFVVKHYESKNMQTLQKEATAEGVIWLTVASSAEGKEGYMSPADTNKYMTEQGSAATAWILDPSGDIGHLYGATATPNMFVIDPEGTLVYAGAIDDNDSFKPETIKGAKNYVREAMKAVKDGKKVEVASSKPYGCGIKYAN